MIPRKRVATVGDISVNAIMFMGSMLINNQKTFEQI
jgi:ATP adenylyltransferase/5',5'''-P-1,P-4-tetraphosphate phosphorylase II